MVIKNNCIIFVRNASLSIDIQYGVNTIRSRDPRRDKYNIDDSIAIPDARYINKQIKLLILNMVLL